MSGWQLLGGLMLATVVLAPFVGMALDQRVGPRFAVLALGTAAALVGYALLAGWLLNGGPT